MALTERDALEQLHRDVLSVDAVLNSLKEETALFQRMMYKNHSQHRRAEFFKHLQEVKRGLAECDLKEISGTFKVAKQAIEQLRLGPGDHHISWKVLSGDLKVQLDSLLRRLISIATSFARIITATQKAFRGLSAQFSMTYFMPFALTMNSILGRITVLLRTLLVRAIQVHGGVALIYLNEVTKSNPLRARVTALQLRGYRMPPAVIEIANA
ncbi:hypothetical protein PINS_up000664 [Pythium insidiosum]|nr:hypothetical protein PINS_up000664 [Pythium insidiosum]